MKISSIFLFGLISLFSCNSVSTIETPSKENIAKTTIMAQEKESETEFLSRVRYYDLILHPEKKAKTWQDFHKAYQETLKKTEYKKSEHYPAIKIYFTQSAVLFFDLLQDNTKEAKEAQIFYFNEMKTLNTHNLKAVYFLTEKLKNDISHTEIRSFCDDVLLKNASSIEESKSFLAKNKNMSAKNKKVNSIRIDMVEYADKLSKI